MKKALLNLFMMLVFFNCPLVLSNDDADIKAMYYRFSTTLMPFIYESVVETVNSHQGSRGGESLSQLAASAYRLWRKNITLSFLLSSDAYQASQPDNSVTSQRLETSTHFLVHGAQLRSLYPSAALIYKNLSPVWVTNTLVRRHNNYNDNYEIDTDRPAVHRIIDRLLDTFGVAFGERPLFYFQVKKQFNIFFNCTYHDCSVMAEALNQEVGGMEKAATAYLECRKRKNTILGKHLFHICDLIFNKPSSFVSHTYSI